MNPLITIIVPIYKVEAYLAACLDSILNQTFSDFELLLIEDGSPDNCGVICDEYSLKDKRIRAFHQDNQGISAVRNFGLSKSIGEFILFVDSDDTIHPELLEDIVDTLKKYKADIVIFQYQAIDLNGEILYSPQINLPVEMVFTMAENPELLLTPASLCNKLIKKSLFHDIYFPEGSWYEDLWMTPKIYLRANKIIYMGSKPLYNYLIRPGSIMHSGNLEKLYTDRTKVLTNLLNYFKSQNLFDEYKSELEALTVLHGFFYASMEILLVGKDITQLMRFRAFVEEEFSSFKANRYLKELSFKQRLQFILLLYKQFSLIRTLSFLKNYIRRMKNRFHKEG